MSVFKVFSVFFRVLRTRLSSDCIVFILATSCLVVSGSPGMAAKPLALGREGSGSGTVGSADFNSSVIFPRVAENRLVPKSEVRVISLNLFGSIDATFFGTMGPSPIVGNQTLLSAALLP